MSVDARVVVADRGVDATVTSGDARPLVLLGPNGSGKSTVLAAIAGTLRPDDGWVRVDGEAAFDTNTWLTPPERRIALVTQRDDLFPSLSVLDNVAFGPRAQGASKADARAQALEWLDRVGLAELSDRRPDQLSGGQARRVAIGRALSARPRALLLDEPFAGVDVDAAAALRRLVTSVSREVTTVVATHEAVDAHLLDALVAVLDAGAVVEQGPASQVLRYPTTTFAATMAGRTLLRGTATQEGLSLADGTMLPAETAGISAGATALVAVRPRDVTIADGGAPHTIPDTVVSVDPHGDTVRITGKRLAADVDPEAGARIAPGDDIGFVLNEAPVAYSASAGTGHAR